MLFDPQIDFASFFIIIKYLNSLNAMNHMTRGVFKHTKKKLILIDIFQLFLIIENRNKINNFSLSFCAFLEITKISSLYLKKNCQNK